MFRLLGTETRHDIIEILRAGPQPVNEIARRLGITQPATSQHLAVLREAGFVTDRRQGQQVFYALEPAPLARYQLGSAALGVRLSTRSSAEALAQYRDFLRRELERVEREITGRGEDDGQDKEA
ncbi:MAG: metalloregulator ArsR/SmtB family transcription factor [bacterium]